MTEKMACYDCGEFHSYSSVCGEVAYSEDCGPSTCYGGDDERKTA